MTARKTNPAFLNGVPEMLILKLLSRRAMYGYELVQAIKAASGETLEFGEGCIYPILHRLEAQGLLSATTESVNGRTRVVYQPTAAGKAQLAQSVNCWQQIVVAVNQTLQGGPHGSASVA